MQFLIEISVVKARTSQSRFPLAAIYAQDCVLLFWKIINEAKRKKFEKRKHYDFLRQTFKVVLC